jgi:hypothetical protein
MEKEPHEKPAVKAEEIKARTFCAAYDCPAWIDQPNHEICCGGRYRNEVVLFQC